MSSSNPFAELSQTVLNNLEFQHDWTKLQVHSTPSLPRPVITGLPPKRLYIHPDEQVEIIKAEKKRKAPILQVPEYEWVLPTHLAEKWTLAKFAEVFDAIDVHPPGSSTVENQPQGEDEVWKPWRGSKLGKRILLAIIQDDSTIVYYFVHDGVVKPRPN
jgi:tRNA-splicing endonuclease subunit Sen15